MNISKKIFPPCFLIIMLIFGIKALFKNPLLIFLRMLSWFSFLLLFSLYLFLFIKVSSFSLDKSVSNFVNRPTLIGLMTSNILSEFLVWNIDFSSLILKHSLIAISNVVEKSFSSKGIWYLTRWISGKRENGKRHSFTFIDEISSDF